MCVSGLSHKPSQRQATLQEEAIRRKKNREAVFQDGLRLREPSGKFEGRCPRKGEYVTAREDIGAR